MSASPSSAAPEVVPFDARPPIEQAGDETAPPPGAADTPYRLLRPTVAPRREVKPKVWDDHHATLGYPPSHHYVRHFWVAALGSGAVADLIRLAVAADRGRSLPEPTYLNLLISEGLAARDGSDLLARTVIPPLAARHVRNLPPRLRREHTHHRFASR